MVQVGDSLPNASLAESAMAYTYYERLTACSVWSCGTTRAARSPNGQVPGEPRYASACPFPEMCVTNSSSAPSTISSASSSESAWNDSKSCSKL